MNITSNIDIQKSIKTNICGEEIHYYEGEKITLVTIEKEIIRGKIKEIKDDSIILILSDYTQIDISLNDLYLAYDFDDEDVFDLL